MARQSERNQGGAGLLHDLDDRGVGALYTLAGLWPSLDLEQRNAVMVLLRAFAPHVCRCADSLQPCPRRNAEGPGSLQLHPEIKRAPRARE